MIVIIHILQKKGTIFLYCINYNKNERIEGDIAYKIQWFVRKDIYDLECDKLKGWVLQPNGNYNDQNTLELKHLWKTYFPLSKDDSVWGMNTTHKLIIFDIMN